MATQQRLLDTDIREDSIFNEFGIVFDRDEAAKLRGTCLGFGIPWLSLLGIAILPFAFHQLARVRYLPIWALNQKGKIPATVNYAAVVLSIVLCLALAISW